MHWDGKLMTDISGKEVVDRLPILVSGVDIDQLLNVPKLPSGTGESMAEAVNKTIDEWGLSDQVKGMCFDTTSSNTGIRNGACILLEQKLEKELLNFGCRHHIHEIVLEAAFNSSLGPSTGPDILLFKRFQSNWKFIDQSEYESILSLENMEGQKIVQTKSKAIIDFAKNQLLKHQPRDDYKELLELTIIFLGGTPERGVCFKVPGALHRARWMAKAIYAIKVLMFRKQFKLTSKEEKGLKNLSIFIVCLYVKAWFLAPLASTAPAQDLQFLKQLHAYKVENSEISTVTVDVRPSLVLK